MAIIGVLHRAIVLLRFRHVLLGLAAARPNLAVAQLFPREIYQDHFWYGVWLLQQTPPIPHLIVKAVLMLTPWPGGVAQLLCAMSGAISIATACLLHGIIRRVTGSATAGFCLALWFLLSTDIVIMEYVFFGQAFYENLGMLWITACCAAFLRVGAGSGATGARRAAFVGLLAALAALTRASLSFFPLVPLALWLMPPAFGRSRWRGRMVLAYLAPIVLLQGGWAVKNAAVYGYFSVETSSWGGLNAANGLAESGQLHLLCADITASPLGTYPDWFLDLAQSCTTPFFASAFVTMPASVTIFDVATRAALGGIEIPLNTLAVSMISAQYHKAVARFILAHPREFAAHFGRAYRVLWQRIGDYADQFYDPLYVQPVERDFPGFLQRGFGEDQRVMLSRKAVAFVPPPPVSRPAWFGTISLAPLDAIAIMALHGLFPLLVLVDLWRRRRGLAALLPPGTGMLAATVAYGLFVFTAVDLGENMRFRMAIEPAIIALSAACGMAGLAAITRGIHRLRKMLSPPSIQPGSAP